MKTKLESDVSIIATLLSWLVGLTAVIAVLMLIAAITLILLLNSLDHVIWGLHLGGR